MTKIEEKIHPEEPHFPPLHTEEWKPIPEFIGYEVSNFGRVRSTDKVVRCILGKKRVEATRKVKGMVRKNLFDLNGYCIVGLPRNGRTCSKKVHLFVALAFIQNPENKPCVNHKDGDKGNPNYLNLEWVTRSENMQHAHKNNLVSHPKGEDMYNAKFTNKEILEIFNSKANSGELAKKYNVAIRTIYAIKEGQNYGSITGKVYDRTKGPKSGEDHPYSVLKSEQVIEIFKSTDSYSALATRFGVSIGAIAKIKQGKDWKRITNKL